MTIVVIFFLHILSNAFKTFFSDLLSKDEVASSNIKILGFINIALAMAILCFCPTDKLLPEIPTLYSYLSLFFSINCLI